MIEEERLCPEAARRFVADAFRRGAPQTGGTAIIEVLPPASRFAPEGGHAKKKQRVLARLSAFFERFYGLGADTD